MSSTQLLENHRTRKSPETIKKVTKNNLETLHVTGVEAAYSSFC